MILNGLVIQEMMVKLDSITLLGIQRLKVPYFTNSLKLRLKLRLKFSNI
nr:MAG TPA: hypothetical protein [Bacteriophage sp.]